MPPRMIGGYVAGPFLVARSNGLLVAARQVLAYPNGCEVEVEAHARGASPAGPPLDPRTFGRQERVRFRLRLADGTEVRQDDRTSSADDLRLSLSKAESSSGGPDNAEDVRVTLWICPLPPPGPMTLTFSWPHRGVHDVGFVLDGDAIRAAASQAQPFWPEGS